MTETLALGYSVLSEGYLVNTNMTGFKWFSKIFDSLCALNENSICNLDGLKTFGEGFQLQHNLKLLFFHMIFGFIKHINRYIPLCVTIPSMNGLSLL